MMNFVSIVILCILDQIRFEPKIRNYHPIHD